MPAIKIIAAPIGEAPLPIREAWIGCILPLPQNALGRRRRWRKLGVLSSAKLSWFARMFVKAELVSGYPVLALDALRVLEQHNPTAAQWWRENTSYLLKPNYILVFDAAACEEVPFG